MASRILWVALALHPAGQLALAADEGNTAATSTGQASVTLTSGLIVQPMTDLHFGFVWVPPTGQQDITVRPDQTGGEEQAEGHPRAAQFRVLGPPGARIQAYTGSKGKYEIPLQRIGGSEQISARVFTTWPNNQGVSVQLDESGQAYFYVGGRITIKAGDLPGRYVGDFNITVDYE